MPMRIRQMYPGERRTFEGRKADTNERVTTAFTILGLDWFPSPTVRGAFYHGALAVADSGEVGILNAISLEFTEPLLALPAPQT